MTVSLECPKIVNIGSGLFKLSKVKQVIVFETCCGISKDCWSRMFILLVLPHNSTVSQQRQGSELHGTVRRVITIRISFTLPPRSGRWHTGRAVQLADTAVTGIRKLFRWHSENHVHRVHQLYASQRCGREVVSWWSQHVNSVIFLADWPSSRKLAVDRNLPGEQSVMLVVFVNF